MTDTVTKLKHLRQRLQDPDFQQSRGLSNEVPYYILAFNPADQPLVTEEISQIRRQVTRETAGVDIVEFNLYQIMWHLLADMGIADDVVTMEETDGLDYLTEQLNNALEMTSLNNPFVTYMQERIPNDQTIVFVTGIGEIFPLIRAHKVLNTMHQVITNVPVIFFYPGVYDSLSLTMFGESKEDNYYRAFQLN
ncbi:DUF1788 domain-containing protein [Levilactobacillus namurensis]|uniref:DUF1788 domain-containing protein n=1 Tax=Levilactobacillus namurensis TaxID=380393 RepID=UPI002231E640|nr:DUF1788 domain-containing protein [Levilactobacillus namurensis]MCW3779301.1 DUF1788 domain-containing protein [Levilactobacillus namurensis]MDT7019849.1 DUF1788 domain-containing protein [Levilactobacillus namurensis]WNN65568.1 DUF1788 domain-containing protein [Levilactobacillus namurensis]